MFIDHDTLSSLAAEVAYMINETENAEPYGIGMGWQDKLESIGNVLQLIAAGDELAEKLHTAVVDGELATFNELLDAHYA